MAQKDYIITFLHHYIITLHITLYYSTYIALQYFIGPYQAGIGLMIKPIF